MTLRVIREPTDRDATLGVLFVDDRFFGFTLEDAIRETAAPVSAWKLAGQTAIPAGTYRVALTQSARFGRVLPLLLDVPGFTGIRIHPGNAAADTDGCLLVGRTRGARWVGQSRAAFDDLFARLQSAPGDLTICIENPASYRREAA